MAMMLMDDSEDDDGPYDGYDRSRYYVGPYGYRVYEIVLMTPEREIYRALSEEEREEFDSRYLKPGCETPAMEEPAAPEPIVFSDDDPYEGYDHRRYCVGPEGRNV